MGDIHSPHLTEIAKDLWQWRKRKNLYVFASHIRSSDNTMQADQEWQLADYAFQQIVEKFHRYFH